MKNLSMLKRLCLVALLAVFGVSLSYGGNTTYYAKARARVGSTGEGKVYASANRTNNPAYTEAGNAVTKNQNNNTDFTFYMYAEADPGYDFTGWSNETNGSSLLPNSDESPYSYSVSSTAERENDATENNLYAIFKPLPIFYFSTTAIVVPNGAGTASVSPAVTNVYGEHWNSTSATTNTITFTATSGANHEFQGWSKTESGEIESSANSYKPTITSNSTNSGSPSNTTLYARFLPYPTGVTASPASMILGEGDSETINAVVTPSGSYSNIGFESSNTSVATVNANGVVTAVSGGEAIILVKALKSDGVTVIATASVSVSVIEKCANPVIVFEPSSDGKTATTTFSTTTENASIYYTIDGGEPSTSSTLYTGPFNVSNGQTVRAITVKPGCKESEVTTSTFVAEKVALPSIDIASNGVSFSCETPGVFFYYTIDGDNPTTSLTPWNGAPLTGLSEGTNIKVIAAKSGMIISDVATKLYYPASGVSGSVVTLNDYEDHKWSYYSDPDCPIHSWNPADVKITYYGNGTKTVTNASAAEAVESPTSFSLDATTVKVGPNDDANVFVYYKTLERENVDGTGNVPYTTIPNPFLVRPTGNSSTVTITPTYGTVYLNWSCTNWTYNGAQSEVTYTYTDPDGNQQSGNGRENGNTTIQVKAETTITLTAKASRNQNSYRPTITARLNSSSGTQIGSVTASGTTVVSSSTSAVTVSSQTITTSNYRGFYAWRVKSKSEGLNITDVNGNSFANNIIPADTEIRFVTSNEYGNEVEFEALWAQAYVTEETEDLASYSNSYERNFHVVTSSTSASSFQKSYPLTVTSRYPDGTNGGGSVTGEFEASSDTKFENITITGATNSTWTANGHDLIVGRGCSGTVGKMRGLSSGTSGDIKYVIRLESGTFGTFDMIDGATHTHSGTVSAKTICGCDYDRAKKDNDKLSISPNSTVYGASSSQSFSGSANRNNLTYDWLIKSGKVQSSKNVGDANADACIYMGNSGSNQNTDANQYQGKRRLIMEGGEVCNIAGGLNNYGNNRNNYIVNDGGWTLQIRLKGGVVRGSVFGAAAFAGASGDRLFIFTGGTIGGWVAGGANGTQNTGGELYGSTSLYMGGKTVIGSESGGTHVGGTSSYGTNGADGGNVFGAGCGILPANGDYQTGTVGRVNNSIVAVADEATIWRDVYGGGNYGWVRDNGTTGIYILGGMVNGSVYGGSNNQQGQEVVITMKGGVIKGNTIGDATKTGGLYGGSNSWGTINNNVTMQINGGQVGTSSKSANIHGGGYGQNTTVSGNVDITLGADGQTTGGVTVYGDVYGGSALGTVNSDASDHTYVTMYKGTINGSLYGGGLGRNTVAANVYGPVKVTVNGGSVKTTDGTGENGSGGVYGANNIYGAPQSSVTVDIYGTDPAPAEGKYALYAVYGGGNQADYLYGNGYPTVTVHGCDNSIEYVYGGGNAAAVAATDVTIWGGNVIGNVFGGGNGAVSAANVNGNATTKIYGGTILNVYGGSNSQGTISGAINVTVNSQAENSGDSPCTMNIGDVYGGGNRAASNVGNLNIVCTGTDGYINRVFGGANAAEITGNVELEINGGNIGSVFGGNNSEQSISGNVTVNIGKAPNSCGVFEIGNVHGGGYGAATGVKGNVEVNIAGGTINGDVYGGSALGKVNTNTSNTTVVNLTGGIIHGDAYGGGLGDSETAADVNGNVTVTLDGTAFTLATTKDDEDNTIPTSGRVFGCNNINGSPKGTVLVKVLSTVAKNVDGTIKDKPTKNSGIYELQAVYGGGNLAAYYPEDPFADGQFSSYKLGENTFTHVNTDKPVQVVIDIDACDEASIEYVYGGGNAAATPATDVLVLGSYEIGNVFGGGNGKDRYTLDGGTTWNENPGADVGIIDTAAYAADHTQGLYGTGKSKASVLGGTVHNLFGASNTKGNVVSESLAYVDNAGTCPLNVGGIYGGGNEAYMDGDSKIELGCIEAMEEIYGGARNADVKGDINLTISSGHFDRVFGGNNIGGTINGSITVTIEETGCNPITIGELYGCGNQAPYTTPEGKHDPIINLISFTSIGNVFGGGFGEKAVVKGNPTVNIDVEEGDNRERDWAYNGQTITFSDGSKVTLPVHEKGEIGAIGTIYGGGNAAKVIGNTTVEMKNGIVENTVFGGGNAADVEGDTSVTILDGTIGGNVYGGGNQGDVTGKTKVQIGEQPTP